MNIQSYITAYNINGKTHVYFFPGMDEQQHPIDRMSFITKVDDYQFTKYDDGAVEYIIENKLNDIVCKIQNISTGASIRKVINIKDDEYR